MRYDAYYYRIFVGIDVEVIRSISLDILVDRY